MAIISVTSVFNGAGDIIGQFGHSNFGTWAAVCFRTNVAKHFVELHDALSFINRGF